MKDFSQTKNKRALFQQLKCEKYSALVLNSFVVHVPFKNLMILSSEKREGNRHRILWYKTGKFSFFPYQIMALIH